MYHNRSKHPFPKIETKKPSFAGKGYGIQATIFLATKYLKTSSPTKNVAMYRYPIGYMYKVIPYSRKFRGRKRELVENKIFTKKTCASSSLVLPNNAKTFMNTSKFTSESFLS